MSVFDKDLLKAARELKRTNPAGWWRFAEEHPDIAAAAVEPRKGKMPKQPKPGGCWEDRKRFYRSRGRHAEGSYAPEETNTGTSDPADRNVSWQMESSSLLDLHVETGGNYLVGFDSDGNPSYIFSNPDQLEVCRECGAALDLPRDREGYVFRGVGGQKEYCSDRCYRDRDNRKDRYRRARARGKRVLSTYSVVYGVPGGQASTGPQELITEDQAAPWTVPCWAADPWLRFWLAGSVPTITEVVPNTYRDPTGERAARRVDQEKVGRRAAPAARRAHADQPIAA